jgi:hypothetical protein
MIRKKREKLREPERLSRVLSRMLRKTVLFNKLDSLEER